MGDVTAPNSGTPGDPRSRTQRIWIALHLLPLTVLVILTVEGVRGQSCPPELLNGDHGSFAYGRSSGLVQLAVLMLAVYVFSAMATTVVAVVTGRDQVPSLRVTLLNLWIVPIAALWDLMFLLVQEDSAQLCETRDWMTLIVLNLPIVLAAAVINRPRRLAPTTPEPFADAARSCDTGRRARAIPHDM